MAVEEAVRRISIPSSGNLAASQYLGVAYDANKRAVVATVLGQNGAGILQNDPAVIDQPCAVAVGGVAKGMAGAAVTVGAKVTVMANGRFQVAASGHHVWGQARTAGGNGEIIEINLDLKLPVLA